MRCTCCESQSRETFVVPYRERVVSCPRNFAQCRLHYEWYLYLVHLVRLADSMSDFLRITTHVAILYDYSTIKKNPGRLRAHLFQVYICPNPPNIEVVEDGELNTNTERS